MTKSNVYLFQPQYGVEYRDENTYWLPYSVGCIWSYATHFSDIREQFHLADIIFRREPVEDVLARMSDPVLCGFSCYIWNKNYCLTLAQEIKQRWPDCVIVFGGAEPSGKLIQHKFIDCIIMGEGEENFTAILRDIAAKRPIEPFYQRQRLQDLDIPSAYTSGVFDQIVKDNPNFVWAMTLETNRGCPYSCTFCDWGGVTYSKIKKFQLEHIHAELNWARANPVVHIFVADANFGILFKRDLEIAHMIREAADNSMISSVNIQYPKNSSENAFEIARVIGPYSKGVTVALQSNNDNTLDAIKRKNLAINDVQKLMKLSQQHKIPTYTELIIGLPNETLESWKQGIADTLEMGQHQTIEVFFAQLLENSELSQPASRQQYGIKSITVRDFVTLYHQNDWRGIDEDMELVQSTNTMSLDDIVDGYLYAATVINFHIHGYSHLYAKYCRNILGISYRQFYDQLFEQFRTGDFAEQFAKSRNIIHQYLSTGEIKDLESFQKNGHGLYHNLNSEYLYDHLDLTFDLTTSVARSLANIPDSIYQLQTNSMYRDSVSYPLTVDTDVDIETWDQGVFQYQIEPSTPNIKDFKKFIFRKLYSTKNKITRV